ncbi:MAG: WD40 repeat domain-containing protein, partial [Chloroflexi bacterium]|nr:WD40 repeat domain-containing protein [Chloroflexota bacterium]
MRPSAEAPGAAVLAPWTPLPLDNLSIPWPPMPDHDWLNTQSPEVGDQGWYWLEYFNSSPQNRIVSPNLIVWARVEETAPPPGPQPPDERVAPQFDRRRRDVRLHVDRVLFGYWPYPALTVSLPAWAAFGDASAGEERHLFKLISGKCEGDRAHAIAYAVSPADEEAAVVAEADARLHYYALAAPRVFVGIRMALGKAPACSTEVVRTLSGGQLPAGARVRTTLPRGWWRPDAQPGEGPMIWFERPPRDQPARGAPGPAEVEVDPVHELMYGLPLQMEAQVRAALARREEFPVVPPAEGAAQAHREIVLRVSTREAIEYLGRTGGDLAERTLILRGKEVLEPVAEAIERELFTVVPDPAAGIQRLRALVRILRAIQAETGSDRLAGLTERCFEHFAAHPDRFPVAPPPRPSPNARQELDWLDLGAEPYHAPTWLLCALPPRVAMERLGTRLLALRDAATGAWRPEVEHAVAAGLDESHLELHAALRAGAGMQAARRGSPVPERMLPWIRDDAVGPFFLPDGKRFRTIGCDGAVRLWDLETLEERQSADLPTGYLPLCAREPDGDRILCRESWEHQRSRSGATALALICAAQGGRLSPSLELPGEAEWYSWQRDGGLLAGHGSSIWRLDGERLQVVPIRSPTHDYACICAVARLDAGDLLVTGAGHMKSSRYDLAIWNPTSGAHVRLGEFNLFAPNALVGTVPGTDHCWIAGSGIHIVDRRTERLVLEREFPGRFIEAVDFAPDGRGFALVTRRLRAREDPLLPDAELDQTVLQLHDGEQGKLLLACAVPAGVRRIRYSPDS